MTSLQTITSLTTVFTQPTSCSSLWTYEPEVFNSVPNGLLLQNALASPLETDCFPPAFTGNGRGSHSQVFSPGICFFGYTTGLLLEGSPTTTICCPTNFAFTASLATSAAPGQLTPQIFSGCVSTFTGGTTTIPGRFITPGGESHDLNTTSVSGLIMMWAQPITVALQQKDLTLFPTTTTSSSVSPETNPPTTTTISSSPASSSASFTTLSPDLHHSSAISTGAIVGIAIAGIVAVLVVLLILIFNFRKRKQTRPNTQIVTEGNRGAMREEVSGYGWQKAELPSTEREIVELQGNSIATEREAAELQGMPISTVSHPVN